MCASSIEQQCPPFDKEHRLSCFDGTRVTLLSGDMLLDAEEAAKTIHLGTARRPWVERDPSLHNKMASMVPRIPRTFFWLSCLLGLAFSLLAAYPAALYQEQLEAVVERYPSRFLETVRLEAFVDPFGIHLVSAIAVAVLAFVIARKQGIPTPLAITLGAILPTGLLALTYVLSDGILKQALAYGRSPSYSVSDEPWLTRNLMQMFRLQDGGRVPSGFVMRQGVLCLALMWLARHPKSPILRWRRKATIGFYATLMLLMILVAVQRVSVGAHEPVDIVLGLGIAVLVFWLIVIPTSAVFYGGARKLLDPLQVIWLLYAGWLLFYSRNARYWILVVFVMAFVLAALPRMPHAVALLRRARTRP